MDALDEGVVAPPLKTIEVGEREHKTVHVNVIAAVFLLRELWHDHNVGNLHHQNDVLALLRLVLVGMDVGLIDISFKNRVWWVAIQIGRRRVCLVIIVIVILLNVYAPAHPNTTRGARCPRIRVGPRLDAYWTGSATPEELARSCRVSRLRKLAHGLQADVANESAAYNQLKRIKQAIDEDPTLMVVWQELRVKHDLLGKMRALRLGGTPDGVKAWGTYINLARPV